ncbi:MAG: pyridoxamine 5-phosphate oxidase [Gammaproteobacteria bacterium CG_4_10_14_0_8_um_filter_38_16]|nr:MAG: pyridoxamine 5-phosphate oxidase [Gammaproteobacteria bacterium CG_4_10_14_0_8_um_filter_38_16]PJA03266.1 MAG: pyridoxamine 5-phosphate oxidase [Gammaproteobacteria bacterium CG_4_10_14_0_2_um_filter_38_22]PJB09832.1 MAG: pyridoxamine 5-phosphate oxidase [Gammaproteobacteria bacterium CG_4_9_14_3_um_filter_38_9]
MIGLELAHSTWDDAEIHAIEKVIKKNHYTMSTEVSECETAFADFFNVKYAVMVNSGSSANLLAIAALSFKKEKPLQRGDEVIVPALSWPTTFYPISQYGMKLVFVDIDLKTLNVDVSEIEKAITEKTKAILVPNILGNPADLMTLQALCKKYDLYLIEDNCESMGASVNQKYAGTYGILGTFSCFFSHHISTMEGGFIVTDNEELYHILLCLRAHGWTRQLPKKNHLCEKSEDSFYEQFRFLLPGYNVRPIEMSGAIGKEQLKKLPMLLQARLDNAKHFVSLFKEDRRFIIQEENGVSSWFGFSFIIDKESDLLRSELLKKLAKNHIETRPIISGNFLRHDVMKYLDHRVIGKQVNANIVHDHGFFIGNHHIDIRKKLDGLHDLLV